MTTKEAKMLESGIHLISRTNLTLFILTVLWFSYGFKSIDCCSDLFSNHFGTTTSDMVIREGDPMEVQCMLHKSSMDFGNGTIEISSEMLLFKYNGTKIPNSKIKILDNLRIQYKVNRTSMKENGFYMCYIDLGLTDVKPKAVCATLVTIAHPPSAHDNFNLRCTGFDLKYLTCTWDLQSYNLATDYHLSLIVHDKFNYSTCPNLVSQNACTFSTRDASPYLISDKKLRFRLDVGNKLGTVTKIFDIDHYSNVVLDKISSLRFVSVGVQNVFITWEPPNSIADDPYLEDITEFLLQVYPVQRDSNSIDINNNGSHPDVINWKITKKIIVKGIRQYNFTDLVPYTKYRFEIRCRLVTDSGDGKWSQEFMDSIQTKPDVPYYFPILHPGGYEVVHNSSSSMDLIVYYDKMDPTEANGPNLTFVLKISPSDSDAIKSSNDIFLESSSFPSYRNLSHILRISPESLLPTIIYDESKQNYVENLTNLETSSFKLHNFDPTIDFKISMFSFNSIGFASGSSSMIIPGAIRPRVHPGVDTFYAINWSGYNYTLHWTVSLKETIKSYTIFWCKVIDTPRCEHNINHIEVSPEKTSIELIINYDKVQFGISVVDVKNGLSSGIQWSQCIESGSFIKVKNRFKRFNLISIGSKSVQAEWKLDCLALYSFIYHFEIHYCQTDLPCAKTLAIIDVDKLSSEYKINNLDSSTGYNFTIYAVTTRGERLESPTITIETKFDLLTGIVLVSVLIVGIISILSIFYSLLVCTMKKRENEKKLKEAVDSNWIPKMPSRLKGDANILLNPLARETCNEYENKEYMNSDSNTDLNGSSLKMKGLNSKFSKDCKNNVILLSTISGNNELNDIIPCSSSISPSTSSSSSSSTTGEPDEGFRSTSIIKSNDKNDAMSRKGLIKSFSSVSTSFSSTHKLRSRKLSDGGGCESEDSGYSTKFSDKNVYYQTVGVGVIKSINGNSSYIVIPDNGSSSISIDEDNSLLASNDNNIVNNNHNHYNHHPNNVTINRSLSDSDFSCNEQTAIHDDYHESSLRNDYLSSSHDDNYQLDQNYLHGHNQDNHHHQTKPDNVNTISNGYVYA